MEYDNMTKEMKENLSLSPSKKSFNKRFSLKLINTRSFVVSIDGSDTSDYAFDLVEENFLGAGDKLTAFYVYNSKKDELYNYRNKKDTIISKHKDRIDILNNKLIDLISEERSSEIHPLQQAHALALERRVNYLVCGFTGMKGPRGCNMELTKGIDYLLRSSKVPFMLIKDKTVCRKDKKEEKYRWLCVVDNEAFGNEQAFQAFLPLIETRQDELEVLSFVKHIDHVDFNKPIFDELVKENNIKNYIYETIELKENMGLIVNNKVNFGQNPYDFLIVLNNKGHYSVNLEKSENFKILGNSKCNICVMNVEFQTPMKAKFNFDLK